MPCRRCGAQWASFGPEGGTCPTHGFIPKAELNDARQSEDGERPAEREVPMSENGAALLDDLAAFIRRYVVLSDAQAEAVALWTAHSHLVGAADATPYLSVTSAEKRSGKTRLLETLELMVARPWLTGRVTAAVLIRKVAGDQPTLLQDG